MYRSTNYHIAGTLINRDCKSISFYLKKKYFFEINQVIISNVNFCSIVSAGDGSDSPVACAPNVSACMRATARKPQQAGCERGGANSRLKRTAP